MLGISVNLTSVALQTRGHFFEVVRKYILTQDGDNICTENGDQILVPTKQKVE